MRLSEALLWFWLAIGIALIAIGIALWAADTTGGC